MSAQNGKRAGIASAAAPPETHETQRRNFACSERDRKAFSALRDQFASKGYRLIRAFTDDGSARFFVERWGLCLELTNIAAVHAFAEHAGVRNG